MAQQKVHKAIEIVVCRTVLKWVTIDPKNKENCLLGSKMPRENGLIVYDEILADKVITKTQCGSYCTVLNESFLGVFWIPILGTGRTLVVESFPYQPQYLRYFHHHP